MDAVITVVAYSPRLLEQSAAEPADAGYQDNRCLLLQTQGLREQRLGRMQWHTA
jgi:hypothetical protein